MSETLTRAEHDALLRKAVADAIEQAVAQTAETIMARLAAANEERGEPVPVAPPPENVSFARALATEIAQLADQGTGKKRVSAEVLEKRVAARIRMEDIVARNRKDNVRPQWELVAGTFLEERWVSPVWIDASHRQQPTKIRWRGIPNGSMRPVDDLAREVWAAFCESIGQSTGGPASVRAKVTAMGNVIESSPIPAGADELGDLDLDEGLIRQPAPQRMSDLEISGRGGKASEIAILGTVARPALQTSI